MFTFCAWDKWSNAAFVTCNVIPLIKIAWLSGCLRHVAMIVRHRNAYHYEIGDIPLIKIDWLSGCLRHVTVILRHRNEYHYEIGMILTSLLSNAALVTG